MGEETAFENGRISDLQLRARDLDLDHGSGHTAYCHASVMDLYLRSEFH